ncbi:uncharacterized protein LOC112091901 [Morus notabilis]|uniref:uncharacterized protein LOC112091901 n=1 Tax=Morus notabilis TaxID=981085 RepID=UPI000CED4D59|nr:uncharacterized protein LOC112091901 [Morus notabilis]
MKNDIREYVSECVTCLRIKAEHQKPAGELQPLPIPRWKWEHITMDFLMGLLKTEQKHDAIWVVVDRLTKSVHFIPFRAMYSRKILAELYLEHIVRLDEVPLSVTFDRDTHFNTSYQASIGMASFEALYGQPCRSPICWLEPEDQLTIEPEVIQKIVVIRERLLTAQNHQKSYADRRRRPLEFQEDNFVLLKWYDVPIQYDTTYEEVPIQILDRKMCHRDIPLVKVLWQHHGVEEATWEFETTMHELHPHLFAF